MKRWLAAAPFVLAVFLMAGSEFESSIMEYFDQRLDELTDVTAFKNFVDSHPHYFPEASFDDPVRVTVSKEHVRIGRKKIKIGTSYLQVVIKAKPELMRQLMESPHWYRDIYDLDRDAALGSVGEDGSFKAHIFKRVPVIPNQDYILSFSCTSQGNLWFQRATLVEDLKDFALRDNLKIIEPVDGGVVFREISFVYPLGWLARALSGVARKTMVKELKVMGNAIKCIAEKGLPFEPDVAASCWERFK